MATISAQSLLSAGLVGLVFTQANSDSDVAAIDGLIVDDSQIVNRNLGPTANTIGGGIIFTGVLSTTTVAGITSVNVTGLSGSTISSIKVGQWIYGPGIPANTQILAVGATTITLSANHTITSGTQSAITGFAVGTKTSGSFSKNGQLIVPGRGSLQIFPGDAVLVDRSGFPFLISKESLAYSGSNWSTS